METERITQLLHAHNNGDKKALNRLVPLVYEEMKRLARHRLQSERHGHTLNTHDLVHEAYLKLLNFNRVNWQNREHFFAFASRVMRNILVDYAVRQQAQKRGGNFKRVTLVDSDAATEANVHDTLSIHQALQKLEKMDKRQVRIVECRFFGGLNMKETAESLGVSEPTVYRDWKMAKAWLNRELADPDYTLPAFHSAEAGSRR
jgi:RNA polymerase sigma factor (TIGR02999 family)